MNMNATVLFTDKNEWNAETATYKIFAPKEKFKGISNYDFENFMKFARENSNIMFFVTNTDKLTTYQIERLNYLRNVTLCEELLQVLEEDREIKESYPSKVGL